MGNWPSKNRFLLGGRPQADIAVVAKRQHHVWEHWERTYPELPPDKKCVSSIMATHSMLPSTYNFRCCCFLFVVTSSSSSRSATSSAPRLPSMTSRSLDDPVPPPRKTSWDSSAIFQYRTDLSEPPAVTATSDFKTERSTIFSWWPKSVSM